MFDPRQPAPATESAELTETPAAAPGRCNQSESRRRGTRDRVNAIAVAYRTMILDGVALPPAGGYLSTVLDLAKWDAVLRTNAVLSDSARRAMWTPVTLSDGTLYPYGFGWELGEFRGRKRIHHGGETRGFRGDFTRFVDDGLTIIVLMNLDDADLGSLVAGIANLYLPRPSSSPR